MERVIVWRTVVTELCCILPFLEAEKLNPADLFVNIGANSLDRINLAISISEKFGINNDSKNICSMAFVDTLDEFCDIICTSTPSLDP